MSHWYIFFREIPVQIALAYFNCAICHLIIQLEELYMWKHVRHLSDLQTFSLL